MNKTENKKKEDILKKAKKIVSIEGWSSEIFSKLQKQNIEKNDLFYFFPDGYKDLLEYALQNINAHYFWHQEDDYTITSKGYIWTYPSKKLLPNSICVLPEKASYKSFNCLGICSDFIEKYKK